MDTKKLADLFNRYIEKAKVYIDDPSKIKDLLAKLEDKIKTVPQLSEVWDTLKSMVDMLKAYVKGEYTDVPKKTIAAIIGTILYLLNPIDLIMDVIPGIGWADDIAVVFLAYNIAKDDIAKYEAWRSARNADAVEVDYTPIDVDFEN